MSPSEVRPRLTLGTYAHLWPTAEDKTRAAASSMAVAVLATSLPHIDTK